MAETIMPRMITPGRIDITNDFELVYGVLRDPNSPIIVIDMDEDNDPNIPKDHPRVIGGECLIPPMEALIAAADGEKEVFNIIYNDHFTTPFIDNYVGAIIISLMIGKQLLIYYSDDDLGIVNGLINVFYSRYGIKIGIIGESEGMLDSTCIPIWLQYMYRENVITGIEFLFNYPVNVQINDVMMTKLINEIMPPGEDKAKEIYQMVYMLKETPTLINPLVSTEAGY